jgi:hypothetical protein
VVVVQSTAMCSGVVAWAVRDREQCGWGGERAARSQKAQPWPAHTMLSKYREVVFARRLLGFGYG